MSRLDFYLNEVRSFLNDETKLAAILKISWLTLSYEEFYIIWNYLTESVTKDYLLNVYLNFLKTTWGIPPKSTPKVSKGTLGQKGYELSLEVIQNYLPKNVFDYIQAHDSELTALDHIVDFKNISDFVPDSKWDFQPPIQLSFQISWVPLLFFVRILGNDEPLTDANFNRLVSIYKQVLLDLQFTLSYNAIQKATEHSYPNEEQFLPLIHECHTRARTLRKALWESIKQETLLRYYSSKGFLA